jgi:hypothetical protein
MKPDNKAQCAAAAFINAHAVPAHSEREGGVDGR